MPKQRMLMVGATGLVGAAAVDHFSQQDDREVWTLSRGTPASTVAAGHLAADLTDPETCRAAFGDCVADSGTNADVKVFKGVQAGRRASRRGDGHLHDHRGEPRSRFC